MAADAAHAQVADSPTERTRSGKSAHFQRVTQSNFDSEKIPSGTGQDLKSYRHNISTTPRRRRRRQRSLSCAKHLSRSFICSMVASARFQMSSSVRPSTRIMGVTPESSFSSGAGKIRMSFRTIASAPNTVSQRPRRKHAVVARALPSGDAERVSSFRRNFGALISLAEHIGKQMRAGYREPGPSAHTPGIGKARGHLLAYPVN